MWECTHIWRAKGHGSGAEGRPAGDNLRVGPVVCACLWLASVPLGSIVSHKQLHRGGAFGWLGVGQRHTGVLASCNFCELRLAFSLCLAALASSFLRAATSL